jgi:hypothetical protein
MCGALADERTCLSFTIATGPRQRSHFQVQVPWDSWPYFTVSDSRLPFSSPPMNRRATIDVFDPASTYDSLVLHNFGKDRIEVTTSNISSIIVRLVLLYRRVWRHVTQQRTSFCCWERNFGNVFTEPLPTDGHVRHNIHTKLYEDWLGHFKSLGEGDTETQTGWRHTYADFLFFQHKQTRLNSELNQHYFMFYCKVKCE